MFEKTFALDFKSMARTLDPEEVCEQDGVTGFYSRTHEDDWTISGYITEDYYYWVNDFEAHHPVFGRVWGDFESTVFADSETAFDAFVSNHAPQEWDYWDI